MKSTVIRMAGLSLLGLAASHVSAQLIYEPFDYGTAAVGTPLGNLTGPPTNGGYVNPMNGMRWFDTNVPASGTVTGTEPTIKAGSLPTTTGQPAAVGDSLVSTSNASTTPSPRIQFLPGLSTGTIYYSLSFRVADITGLTTNANGAFVAGFNNLAGTQTTTPTAVLGRLTLYRPDASKNEFAVGVTPNTTGASHYPTPLKTFKADSATDGAGDTVFVVVAVDPTAGNQTTSMWINPDPSTFGQAKSPTPDVGPFTGGGDPVGGITSFTFRLGNAITPTSTVFDDLRVDRTWAQVAPAAGVNWSTGSTPDGIGTFVNLTGAGGAVALTGTKTAGTLNFKGPNAYTLSGGTLSLDGSTVNPSTLATDAGPATINAYASIDPATGAAVATTHTISPNVTVAQNLNAHVAQAQTVALTGDATFAAGTSLTKTGPGILQMKNLRADAVFVNGGKLQIAPNGTAAGVSVVKSVSFNYNGANPAALDLTDNDLVVDYTDATVYANVQSQVKTGYAAGLWNGNGLTSSSAAANANTGLAVVEASDLLGPAGGNFNGQPVDGSAILVKYTYNGDLNFDGKVNADDYATIDRFVAQNPGGVSNGRWLDGDFNYDGKVDAADYAMMDKAFAFQGGPLDAAFLAQRESQFGADYVQSLLASVPEPSTAALFALVLLSPLRRLRTKK